MVEKLNGLYRLDKGSTNYATSKSMLIVAHILQEQLRKNNKR